MNYFISPVTQLVRLDISQVLRRYMDLKVMFLESTDCLRARYFVFCSTIDKLPLIDLEIASS